MIVHPIPGSWTELHGKGLNWIILNCDAMNVSAAQNGAIVHAEYTMRSWSLKTPLAPWKERAPLEPGNQTSFANAHLICWRWPSWSWMFIVLGLEMINSTSQNVAVICPQKARHANECYRPSLVIDMNASLGRPEISPLTWFNPDILTRLDATRFIW